MHIVSSKDICDSTNRVVLYYEISAAIKYYKIYTSNIDYLLAESKLHSRKTSRKPRLFGNAEMSDNFHSYLSYSYECY